MVELEKQFRSVLTVIVGEENETQYQMVILWRWRYQQNQVVAKKVFVSYVKKNYLQ